MRAKILFVLILMVVAGMARAQQQATAQEQAALNAYTQLGLVMQIYLDQERAQRADAESRLKWVLDNWVPHAKK